MKKLTAEWVRKSEADLAAAASLIERKPPLTDPICFHCQQAVEKYLKALLHEHNYPVPRIHDLDNLLTSVIPVAATLARFRRRLNRLTQYAVDYRYPGIHASSRQARSALRIANEVCNEIRNCLNMRPRSRRRK